MIICFNKMLHPSSFQPYIRHAYSRSLSLSFDYIRIQSTTQLEQLRESIDNRPKKGLSSWYCNLKSIVELRKDIIFIYLRSQ